MYPGQMLLDKEQRPYIRQRPPVSNLALVRSQRVDEGRPAGPEGDAEIRLWIETEAAACMPAVDVAALYKHVTMLRISSSDQPSKSMTMTEADLRFDRLFQPYDGSGRFYFREAMFSR
jgi:hypothetical protein